MRIVVIFTCFNRKDKTIQAINSLVNGNESIDFSFVVVDDNSTDGTIEAINSLSKDIDIHLIIGTGNLYYSRGMHIGMEYVKKQKQQSYDYLLMINDDVQFYNNCVENLISKSLNNDNSIIVGATCDDDGNQTYGAVKYLKGIKYKTISCEESTVNGDTFNANCVLIPYFIFKSSEIMDKYYLHGAGDFDYGLSLKREGFNIFSSDSYVGICNKNMINNTWLDRSMSIRKRIKEKESPKGLPLKQWYYFLNKNFGFRRGIIGSVTPYIRIFLGR